MIIWISSSNSTLLTILGNDKNVTINNIIPEIPVIRTITGYKILTTLIVRCAYQSTAVFDE